MRLDFEKVARPFKNKLSRIENEIENSLSLSSAVKYYILFYKNLSFLFLILFSWILNFISFKSLIKIQPQYLIFFFGLMFFLKKDKYEPNIKHDLKKIYLARFY